MRWLCIIMVLVLMGCAATPPAPPGDFDQDTRSISSETTDVIEDMQDNPVKWYLVAIIGIALLIVFTSATGLTCGHSTSSLCL